MTARPRQFVRIACWALTFQVNWLCLGQAVIEGTVHLRTPPGPPPSVRYAHLPVQPGPPDPPTAVVYLEGNFPAGAAPQAPSVYTMGQTNLQFYPALLPVPRGATVEFPNHDDLYHNVFSYSKPRRFDLGRYRRDEKPAAQVFDQAGVVKLNCEIHNHMRATILVLDTPYFQRTTTNGTYRLENLPTGTFKLKAWINEKTVHETAVTLEPGKVLKIDFPADAAAP